MEKRAVSIIASFVFACAPAWATEKEQAPEVRPTPVPAAAKDTSYPRDFKTGLPAGQNTTQKSERTRSEGGITSDDDWEARR